MFLITDRAPNNHPGHQNSGISVAMALLFIRLVENKKLDMIPKFELPRPCGVDLRRPKRQMFRIVIQGSY